MTHDTPTGRPAPSGGADEPALLPGQLLADRYRVVRFIARGGMGEVYEAEDLELRARIALKTLRRELASDDAALERFRREILLSRRVTHPNVCRVFDVFRHQEREGAVLFLTMELLEGETLSQRIRQRGRFDTKEAAPIVEQLCAALAAAHDAGVVHRDFKTANVILTRAGRVVVTDFGLARAIGVPPADDSREGKRVGTSAYMAPEQVEGAPVGVVTDVYALGIVMFEMVTGRVPFQGTTPLSTAMMRLKEPPPAPRLFVPDLDPSWEAVILRCLQRPAGARYPDASSVWRALGPSVRSRRRVPLAMAAFATAVVVSALAFVWQGPALRDPGPTAPFASPTARRAVAVMGIANLTRRPEVDWLGPALAEMLATELSAGGRLRMIPGESVSRMKLELGLPDTETLAGDTLDRVRRNLGCDVVIVGSYVAVGAGTGSLRFDVRAQDTRAGETVATVSETGSESDLLELVARVGSRLRAELGAGVLTPDQMGGLRATLPGNPEAARLYGAGLDRLRRSDALGARGLLEQAAQADPDHPLVHAALADVWGALGYDARAEDAARRAFELSTHLPREEKLLVQARFHEHNRDWARAVDDYRSLVSMFPDSIDLGLRLASVQTAAGRPADALKTLQGVRAIPRADDSPDPRIELAEAAAATSLSDYPGAHAAAQRAVAAGNALGARLLVAHARAWSGWALWNLGEPQEARQAYEDARAIYAAAGDRVGEARALRGLGTVLAARGELSGALELFRAALEASRETGRKGGEALALSNIGNVLLKKGDLAGARRHFEQALALRRETGGSGGLANSLTNVANVLHELGDLGSARRLHEEALTLKRGIGEKLGVAVGLNSLADVRLAEGDLDAAERMYRDARSTAQEIGSRRSVAYALHGVGEVLFARGDLVGARRAHAEALAIRQALGERGNVAASRTALAQIDLAERRAPEVERAMAPAIEEFAQEGRIVEQAIGTALLSRALLDQGRLAPAQAAADRATTLVARTENVAARVQVALTGGMVRAAQGRPGDAVRLFDGALEQARRYGFAGLELEARLAMAALEVDTGQHVAAGRRLEVLVRDARAQGYGRVVARAEALVGKRGGE